MAEDPAAPEPAPQERVETVLAEWGFEIRWLHERVNALLAAEAFLTIAFTAAMSSDGDRERRRRGGNPPRHSEAIAHRGACGKTPSLPQHRRPEPET